MAYTIQELKKKLGSVKWLDKEIQALNLELQYLEKGLFRRSTLTQVRTQVSNSNQTEDKLVALIKQKDDINRRLEQVADKRLEVIGLIDKVTDPKKRIALMLYYIQQKHTSDICEMMTISRNTFFKLLKQGLNSLLDLLNSEGNHEQSKTKQG